MAGQLCDAAARANVSYADGIFTKGAKTARSRFNASITNSSPEAARTSYGMKTISRRPVARTPPEYIELLATFQKPSARISYAVSSPADRLRAVKQSNETITMDGAASAVAAEIHDPPDRKSVV